LSTYDERGEGTSLRSEVKKAHSTSHQGVTQLDAVSVTDAAASPSVFAFASVTAFGVDAGWRPSVHRDKFQEEENLLSMKMSTS
jgi:hypothetical protein